MARKAGVISIDIDAGTSKFLIDMDKANAKLQSFGKTATESGHSTVSAMQASSAGIRLLENPLGNNIRALERFIAMAPGASRAFQAIFPAVGAAVAVGLVVRLGDEVVKFYQKIESAPQRIAAAFREINAPLQLTNDALALSNDRLRNDIAKLEGKPQNGLAIALDEARVMADKLGESLDRDLKGLNKLLRDNGISRWETLATALIPGMHTAVGTGDFAKQVGGAIGSGGWTGQIEALTDQFRTQLGGVSPSDTKGQNAIKAAARTAIAAKFAEIDKAIADEITKNQMAKAASPGGASYDAILEMQTEARRTFAGMSKDSSLEFQNADLQGKKAELEPGAEERKKAAEALLEAQKKLTEAQEKQATALERIDIAEIAQIQNYNDLGVMSAELLAITQQTFDIDRLNEYNKLMKETVNVHLNLGEALKKVTTEEAAIAIFGPQFATAVKNFESGAKAADEWAKSIDKITAASRSESARHGSAMAGIYGNPNDPLGTLATQQALEKAQIEATYQEKLKAAVNDLDKQVALNEKNLELLKLQDQMEESIAEHRHKSIDDFFKDMRGQSKNAGDIFYDGMHNALDKLSDDMATLLMHPKGTNVRKMLGGTLKDIGGGMAKEATHSLLQRALGHFGKHATTGKPDGSTEPLALWVRMAQLNPIANPLAPLMPALPPALGSGNASAGGGGFGKLFGGALGNGIYNLLGGGAGGVATSTDSSITFMAAGGDANPGNVYGVAEAGEAELVSPKHSSRITPVSKLGGDTHNYYINAAHGVSHAEMYSAMITAHKASVATGVQANVEFSKRTPQKS
jgi:hypothetical protein